MSGEKELQLIHNILVAFAAAPKRPVPNANPATTDAWVAEVNFCGLTVEIFYSHVSAAPWHTEEHLVLSHQASGQREEFFRASRSLGTEWIVRHSSPLAWALFGQGMQQPMGKTIAVGMPVATTTAAA